jgi:alanine-glyoxylate transaminase/serine-glyoxylate transaminase/serine-pyruvate transaminase
MSLYHKSPGSSAKLPDPNGLKEFSVVFTDHSLNHMSKQFQAVMKDITTILSDLHKADKVILVPGGGTFAMESVARHVFLQEPLASRKAVVVRNGWFSYRWSQILEDCGLVLGDNAKVLQARQEPQHARETGRRSSPFSPPPINDVVSAIEAVRPGAVFVPHVETSSGILLPDEYISSLAAAAHRVGAVVVLDCIASGALFVDMSRLQVDYVIAAPQKSYSGPAGCGIVLARGTRAQQSLAVAGSSLLGGSFAGDLRKWFQISEAYRQGGFAYHATMPTDMLKAFRDQLLALREFGFEKATDRQWALGQAVRRALETRGFPSVAAPGFQAPGVVVSYTSNDAIKSGKLFADCGLQVAAGVPLQCGEGPDFKTFRIGLFGMYKLENIPRAVDSLTQAIDRFPADKINSSKL